MALIKSISGIRGTIGGTPNKNFTPLDIVKFTSAYANWLKQNLPNKDSYKVIVGRDARISGDVVNQIVTATLRSMAIDVVDLGLSTTPTVEVMVPYLVADGGIILTASHNPTEWNALKLLNHKGEFLSAKDGEDVLKWAENEDFTYADVHNLGDYTRYDGAMELHVEKVLELPWVDVEAVKNAGFKVVIDAVNSTGGIAIPLLLDKMGVEYEKLYCEPNGLFPHNPEPLAENLTEISDKVKTSGANLGIVVDPDVDRLALVNEDGSMFGEEYTLVAVADYLLSKKSSATVSNLSSSRALRDVTEKHGGTYYPSAVGEVNVVEKMKEVNAIIGGEGNGGIILPELHYGRDALVGIAILLTYLAEKNIALSALKATYTEYFMAKKKIQLTPDIDVDTLLLRAKEHYAKSHDVNTVDGVKIDFPDEWVHLRKSNTEPIIRVYTEAKSPERANQLADETIEELNHLKG